jgi:hypothetical protein
MIIGSRLGSGGVARQGGGSVDGIAAQGRDGNSPPAARRGERSPVGPGAGQAQAAASQQGRPKYLRVVVDTEDANHGGGPTKVNVRVPMQLLRAGVKLGALIPAQAREKANAALHEQGIPFDIGQLKPENVETLIEQLNDLTVDVDNEKAKVRIFCE